MVKKAVLVVVGLIVAANIVVLALAASRPDTFRVEWTATIKAPPEAIYANIADFRRWDRWSPWEELDPAMKRDFSGSPQGVGAVYAWHGNNDVGQGRMEITLAQPPNRLVIRLDFLKPFEAHNMAEFTLEPSGDATRVSWAMHGPAPLYARVMHLFLDMDSMVGDKFEDGLAKLKVLAEG